MDESKINGALVDPINARSMMCCGPSGCGVWTEDENEDGAARLCSAWNCMAWTWFDPEWDEKVETQIIKAHGTTKRGVKLKQGSLETTEISKVKSVRTHRYPRRGYCGWLGVKT